MAAPGPAIILHLELAVQSMKVPREPILKNKRQKCFCASRGLIGATRLCALPSAAALHIKEPPFLKSWIRPWAAHAANLGWVACVAMLLLDQVLQLCTNPVQHLLDIHAECSNVLLLFHFGAGHTAPSWVDTHMLLLLGTTLIVLLEPSYDTHVQLLHVACFVVHKYSNHYWTYKPNDFMPMTL